MMIGISSVYEFMIIWLILIFSIRCYFWIKECIYYPPGPYNIPFIGYVPFILAKHPHKLLDKLRHKYGNLFGFHVGKRYILVLNDYATVKDLINKEEFLNRPNIPPMSLLNKNSLVSSNGRIYKREKRLSMKILHKLAFENKFLESVIQEEIFNLMKDFQKLEGKPCDIRYLLKRSTSNNISSLLFGQRLDYDDHRSRIMLESTELFDSCNFYGDPSVFFPFLKPLVYLFTDYERRLLWSDMMESVLRKEVDERNQRLNENHVIDYMNAYLSEVKTSPLHSVNSLLGNSKAFFIGGSVTLSSTFEWFVIAMAIYRDVQSRCFEEINRVVGLERPVEMSDFTTLTYVRAVMLETFRWKTLVPLNLARSIANDVEYRGYILPKNAFVFVNIWAIHNDPEIWKKPEEFYPENFLDEDGNIINSEFCIPFSIGRRSCPGENIAILEAFLYMAAFIQKYTFHPPSDKETFDLDGITTLTHYSKPFEILFRPRT
ncbi:cytochrome P450 2J6-like [Centruroides sculpturatus]|uniref:cytochrome P450 2J6-like n=1 Tax=Centruroides sculpturatus TaxID=218467 RepID=UPI000C6E1F31|nr:cytochrome P450 2J6-like [Centruroides sculpturatus]